MDERFILPGPSVKDRVLALVTKIREEGELTDEVKDALEDTDPFLIEGVENELLGDGLSRDDIMLLCDARSHLFIAAEEVDETILERPGHPIHTLMEEHRQILQFMSPIVRNEPSASASASSASTVLRTDISTFAFIS